MSRKGNLKRKVDSAIDELGGPLQGYFVVVVSSKSARAIIGSSDDHDDQVQLENAVQFYASQMKEKVNE